MSRKFRTKRTTRLHVIRFLALLLGLVGFALTAQAADERWSDKFSIQSGCEDAVWVVEPGPEDTLFIGGDFDGCDGVAANHVIQYHPATGEWTRLGTEAENGVSNSVATVGIVQALAWDGETLFVGGAFDQAGDIPASRLAAWHPGNSQWSVVDNGVDGVVHDLVILEDWLYVGGNFSSVDIEAPMAVNNLARWNRIDGDWSQPGSGLDGAVRALLVDGADLYVGGNFSQADPDAASPVAANHIARFDGENWHALGSGAGNGTDAAVVALAASPEGLYVGGFFQSVNVGDAITANHIALWDGNDWQALIEGDGNGVSGGPVETLVYDDGRLYLGGRFNTLAVGAPEPISSPRLAYWEDDTWFGLVEDVDFSWGGLGPRSMAMVGEDLFIGGAFGRVTDTTGTRIPAFGLSRFDGEQFYPVGTGQGASFDILQMVEFQGQLHAAGWFEEIGGIQASRIARFDGNAWHPLGNGGGEGLNDVVEALAVHDGALYAGGRFTQANPGSSGAISVSRIARWDGNEWSAVGASGGQGVNNIVRALLSTPDGLVVGGDFTTVNTGNAITAGHIARVSNNQWSAIEGSGGEGLDDRVYSLLEHDGTLYVGGMFSTANTGNPVPAELIARHAAGEWSALPGGPVDGGVMRVQAMAVVNDGLYAGGSFNQIDPTDPQSAPNIARWDLVAESWSPLETPAGDTVGLSGQVYGLVAQDGFLYVTGLFTSGTGPGGISMSRVGRWDGEQWAALGSGIERALSSNPQLAIGRDLLAVDPDTLWVSGNFRRAGDRSSHHIGQYALRGTLAVEVTGNGSGSVSSQPAGIDCPGDCSLTQPWDQPVELVAVPGTGSVFAGFSGGGCTTSPCNLPFDQSTTVTAQFDLNSYIVTTLANNGTITSPLDPVVDHGQTITVTGQADPGHHFTAVSGCGGTAQSNSDQSMTVFSYATGAIIDDCTVEADFEINSYTLEVSVVGQGSVTPGLQSVDHGDSASWSVSPAADWSVYSFTGDTCVPIDNLDGTWTASDIEASCNLAAEFRPDTTTTVQTSNNPAVVGLPVTYTVEVTGIDTPPAGGQAVVIASTGEACTDETPVATGPLSVAFACQITYPGTGSRMVEASYADSDTHTGSDAPAVEQNVVASATIFQDRFED